MLGLSKDSTDVALKKDHQEIALIIQKHGGKKSEEIQ